MRHLPEAGRLTAASRPARRRVETRPLPIESPRNVRVIVRTSADAEAVAECKAALGERTAAKALMAAAKMVPGLTREVRELRRERDELAAMRDALRQAMGVTGPGQ